MKCTECLEEKNNNCFYSNGRGGYRSKCKQCIKSRQRKYRSNNKESINEYQKKYYNNNREKYRDYQRNYYKKKYGTYTPLTEEEKKERKRFSDIKVWNKYPEKRKARIKVTLHKVKQGYHKHHWSYKEEHWEDYIVLKQSTHLSLHSYLEYDQENMCYISKDGILLDTRKKHEDYIKVLIIRGDIKI